MQLTVQPEVVMAHCLLAWQEEREYAMFFLMFKEVYREASSADFHLTWS